MAELGSSKIYGNLIVTGNTDIKGTITGMPNATTTSDGLMSSTDKVTLNNLNSEAVRTNGEQDISGIKKFNDGLRTGDVAMFYNPVAKTLDFSFT